MKKILIVATNDYTSWGGSEVLWYQLARQFLQNNYDVAINIKNWQPEPFHIKELTELGAKLFLRGYLPPIGILERVYNKITKKRFDLARINDVKQFNPDLIIISQGGNQDGDNWMKFCIKYSFKYVCISQAADYASWPTGELKQNLKEGYLKSSISYFVSKANLELTQLQIVATIPQAKVIFNPFNVSYNSRIKYPENIDFYHLANVARHDFNAKGQDVLLEVIADEKWKSRNLKVNFYGNGQHSQTLKELILYFGLKNAEIKGHQETSSIWANNHALVLPSRYEGLPLALVEAMLAGRFGIVTNVSGNAEVLVDNKNGFVAAAPKAEYLDEAMERAWNRRNEWEEIGLHANKYIKTIVPEDPVAMLRKDIEKLCN